MKKILTLMIATIITFSLLTACGGGNSGSGSNTSAPPAPANSGSSTPPASTGSGNSSPAPSNAPAVEAPKFERREVDVPGEILKLTDESIYFVNIDGVKYDLLDVTVQDFLNAGFTFDRSSESVDREVEPQKRAALSFTLLTKGSDNQTVNISAKNVTDKALPLKNCKVTGVQFGTSTDFGGQNSSGLDIALVCNLGIACTEADVLGVFGEDYWRLMYDSELTYNDGSNGFSFKKDESGTVFNIELYYGGLYD